MSASIIDVYHVIEQASENGIAYISQQSIAAQLEVSPVTVRRREKWLTDNGYIYRKSSNRHTEPTVTLHRPLELSNNGNLLKEEKVCRVFDMSSDVGYIASVIEHINAKGERATRCRIEAVMMKHGMPDMIIRILRIPHALAKLIQRARFLVKRRQEWKRLCALPIRELRELFVRAGKYIGAFKMRQQKAKSEGRPWTEGGKLRWWVGYERRLAAALAIPRPAEKGGL